MRNLKMNTETTATDSNIDIDVIKDVINQVQAATNEASY